MVSDGRPRIELEWIVAADVFSVAYDPSWVRSFGTALWECKSSPEVVVEDSSYKVLYIYLSGPQLHKSIRQICSGGCYWKFAHLTQRSWLGRAKRGSWFYLSREMMRFDM